MLEAIGGAQPEPLASLRPKTPPELSSIVARCLAKRAEDRFQSADELLAALIELAPEWPGRVRTTRRSDTGNDHPRAARVQGVGADVSPRRHEMSEIPSEYRGWWRIVDTTHWMNDGLDLLGPALLSLTGYADRLRMHCLLAYVKCKLTKTGVSFTWEGAWEYDPMSGSGRVMLGKDGRLSVCD